MVNVYLLEHNDQNGNDYRNVSDVLKEFFQEKKIEPTVIDWPCEKWHFGYGDYVINEVTQRLDFSKLEKPFVVLNSHGTFHGRTFFFVNGLQEDVAYMHIDAHPDGCYVNEGKVNCQGFVNRVLKLDRVQEVYLLGIDPGAIHDCLGEYMGDEDSGCFMESYTRVMWDDKVRFFLGESILQFEKRVKEFDHEFIERMYDWEERIRRIKKFSSKYSLLKDFNPRNVSPEKVYVSIDLDVLAGFPSGWSRSGRISLDELVNLISLIGQEKQIVGADICGLEVKDEFGKEISQEEKIRALESIFRIYSKLCEVMR